MKDHPTEKEWATRFSNLVQNEKDSIKSILNSIDKLGDVLEREEYEAVIERSKIFKPKDYKHIDELNQIMVLINNLKPNSRNFKIFLDRIEKELTNRRVQNASMLEKLNSNLKKINEEIEMREKRQIPVETPALYPKISEKVFFESPISEFQDFLHRYGGRTGGWDIHSHAEFLKLLELHGAKDLHKYLPNVPHQAIIAHIEWNNQYIQLKRKMKEALSSMKHKVNAPNDDEKQESIQVDAEEVKKRLDERNRIKQQKKQEEFMFAEEKRRKDEEEKKNKFLRLQNELKERVLKPKPIVEKNIEDIEVDIRHKAYSQKEWERIRQKNNDIVEKKAEIIRKQEEEQLARIEKEKKIADLNAKKYKDVKRDPERLMKPTSALLAKKIKDENEPKGPVNSVFDIPHRATPAWLL